jgi:hypothetical protein
VIVVGGAIEVPQSGSEKSSMVGPGQPASEGAPQLHAQLAPGILGLPTPSRTNVP